MSRRLCTAVCALALTALGAPTAAQAAPKYLTDYSHAYHVAQKAGHQVGRNIRRDGYRTKTGRVRAPRRAEVEASTVVLRRMVAPPPVVVVPSTVSAAPSVSSPQTAGSSAPSSGGYCGAYQFDQQTWNSVGGSGSPCGASPAEQDRRATILQGQRGNAPWPHCGQGGASLAQIRQCENGGHY